MKTGTALVVVLLGAASFPLLAQRPPPASQPNGSPGQQSSPAAQQSPSTQPATQDEPANSGSTAAPLNSVSGELVGILDSKSAKSGDPIVVETDKPASTSEGMNIPKGSRLVGHVLAAQPSGGTQNSQVALQFDHLELKGGQSVPIEMQVQAITSASNSASITAPKSTHGSPAGGRTGAASDPGSPPAAGSTNRVSPAPGTVITTNGKIDIRTTAIPGVMVANNLAGQHDPRMAQASSILIGAKQDILLAEGTEMVVGISASSGGTR